MTDLTASTPSEAPRPEQPQHDPNIQTKFLIIFGLFALLPFVLFWQFGLNRDEKAPVEQPALPTIPQVAFADITAASGIDFTHFNGAEGEKLLPETMGSGCAFLDFDADGDQDILLVNSTSWPWSKNPRATTSALYENDGTGKFKNVTAGSGLDVSFYGMGVAVGDYNNDGRVDVFITIVGENKLFQNLGGGKFKDVTANAGIGGSSRDWGSGSAFLDFDRDGDLDLFVCNYVQWSRELDLEVNYELPGIGRAYGPPMNFAGTFPVLYRNEGNGRFTDISTAAGVQVKNKATGVPMGKSLGVSPVDLDNDGWIDIVVANDTVQNFVFHNNKNGTFSEIGGRSGLAFDRYGSVRGAMGIDTGRFQNDDTLAISIGNFANEMTGFYVAQNDPLFFTDQAWDAGIGAPSRDILTFGVFLFDYDLDGLLDLLTINGHIEPEITKVHPSQSYLQPAQLFWNTGRKQQQFILVPKENCGPDVYQPLAGRGSAYADIDKDGDLDVLITQVNGPARLLRNDQKLRHNWLRLKLTGRKVNRDGIGAWVKVRTNKRTLSRQVMPTRGYLSQSELPVTIGLGASEQPAAVQILWPDGSQQEVASSVNQVVPVQQN